jgi:fido (protein-threonine AMPylation protein)
MTALLNTAPGNTPIDPDELAQLIPSLATKAELDEWERRNILEAHDWALNSRGIKISDAFDEPYFRELHRRMFNRTWKWAGTYRSSEKNIGAPVHEIRNRIPALDRFRVRPSSAHSRSNRSVSFALSPTETADMRVCTRMSSL